MILTLKVFEDVFDFLDNSFALVLRFCLVSPEAETDRGDGFLLSFEFVQSFLVPFLDFGVAYYIQKDLYDEIMVRVFDFGLSVTHFWNVDKIYVLDIDGFYDGVELKKFFNYDREQSYLNSFLG